MKVRRGAAQLTTFRFVWVNVCENPVPARCVETADWSIEVKTSWGRRRAEHRSGHAHGARLSYRRVLWTADLTGV